ncbi:serpin family protein [Dactylosporangium sp. CS-033363]|uniref:serpin family protein n=1 Tax=Dactylosporangium sp. CS-033363 TaxID=3239935 RepID=UPI003D8E6359
MTTANANALTARWTSTVDTKNTALSGPGVYVLLALLAPFADGQVRADLLAVAPEPLELPESPTTRMATAVWSRTGVPLTDAFVAAVPAASRGPLTGDPGTDQPVLDAWADEQTGGAIPAMPIQVDEDTLMVLASALAVHTTWSSPFRDVPRCPQAGPWAGRDLNGLHRRDRNIKALRVADTEGGPITLLTVAGADDVDVVLALSEPGRPASEVLPAAIGGLPTASQGDNGPGISVREIEAADDEPELLVDTVRFRVEGRHDLLEQAGVFGLAAATDRDEGHFSGVSPVPLAVDRARQDAVAEFSATGFKAAAVTGLSMVLAGAFRPQYQYKKRLVSVTFDRPFGFLAVHRATGLVLVAGWVEEPEPAEPEL